MSIRFVPGVQLCLATQHRWGDLVLACLASFEKETSLFTATNIYRWGWPDAYEISGEICYEMAKSVSCFNDRKSLRETHQNLLNSTRFSISKPSINKNFSHKETLSNNHFLEKSISGLK
jgi:hypothetical protein